MRISSFVTNFEKINKLFAHFLKIQKFFGLEISITCKICIAFDFKLFIRDQRKRFMYKRVFFVILAY